MGKFLSFRGLALALAVCFLAFVVSTPIVAEQASGPSISVHTNVVDYTPHRNAEPEYWADVDISIDSKDPDGLEALEVLRKFYVSKGRLADAEQLRDAQSHRRQKWTPTQDESDRVPPVDRIILGPQ
jgi:hypothetical protein